VRFHFGGGSSIPSGSGTLLDNDAVLTAGHVLSRANCRRSDQPKSVATGEPAGNTWHTCSFLPSSHLVGLGNSAAPRQTPPSWQAVRRVSVHPQYVPFESDDLSTGIDVAILRTRSPFAINGSTSGFNRFVSSKPASSLVGNSLSCFGYGRHNPLDCDDASGVGILRTATWRMASASSAGTALLSPAGRTNAWRGDSGGPCMDGIDVAGVMFQGDCRASNPQSVGGTGIITADAFRTWAGMVRESIFDINARLFVPLVDVDDTPDAVFLFGNQVVSLLPGTWFVVKILFSNGRRMEFPVLPDNGLSSSIRSLSFASGNFRGNGRQDLVGQVNAGAFYYTAESERFEPPGRSFSFLPGVEYARFAVGDFDGDGFDDLEAETVGGIAHVYYGSSSGLTAGRVTYGFPTDSRYDGRFMLITSATPNVTHPSPTVEFPIDARSDDPDLRVEVFDGRNGTGFDGSKGSDLRQPCFRLYADPMENGSGVTQENLIVQVSGSRLAENQYSTIYKGPNVEKARTFGGHFAYRLVATEDECDGTSAGGANAFKVRSTGFVYAPDGFSFWGRDWQGPATVGGISGSAITSLYDTEYDGVWNSFGLLPGSTTSSVKLLDADSDRHDDVDHPGREAIANDIDYVVRDFRTSEVLCTNSNPSGNLEVEEFNCSFTSSKHEFLVWEWHKVLQNNMIQVWYAGSRLRMSARPFERLPVTSVRPADEWLETARADLAGLLPVLLGRQDACGNTIGSSVLVKGVADATRILDQKAGHDYGGARTLREFRQELLALKLNAAHAALIGEPLLEGWVYGTSTLIGDLLSAAEEALARHCHGLTCMSRCPGEPGVFPAQGNNLAALEHLLPLLRAVNAREVIYEPPPELPPASPAEAE
jgi:hypothetical protein